MSSISQVGIPGVGPGLVRPMLQHRFHVAFTTPDGTELDVSKQLAAEVIRIGPLATNPMHPFGFHRFSNTSMIVQDDIQSNALKALQELYKTEMFNVKINYVDGGNELLRTAVLTEAAIRQMTFSELDYAGPAQDAKVTSLHVADRHLQSLDAPIFGDIIQLINGTTAVTELQRNRHSSSALTIRVDIDYTDIKFTFPN